MAHDCAGMQGHFISQKALRAKGRIIPSGAVPRQTDPLPPDTDGYAFTASQWANRPGRTFTWSNATTDQTALDSNRQVLIDQPLTTAQLVLFRQALGRWTDICDVHFSEVVDSYDVELRVSVALIGSNFVGFANYWFNNNVRYETLIRFAPGTVTNANTHYNSGWTPLHEIGHILGLGHNTGSTALQIMRVPAVIGASVFLRSGDILGAQHLYGTNGTLTSDTDTIYIRGTSNPSIPSGGTFVESHLPTGWSRSNPGATTTQNVYRVERERDYTNNLFSGAGNWGTLTRVEDATGTVVAPIAASTAWTENYNFDTSNDFGFTSDADNWSIPSSWLVEDTLTTAFFYITTFIVSGQLRLSTVRSGDEAPSAAGPHLKEEVRTGVVLTLQSPYGGVHITGIGDTTDPYAWTPSNFADVVAWADGLTSSDSITGTFSYGVDPRILVKLLTIFGIGKLEPQIGRRSKTSTP